jgi:secreted PhoX family phosphatase
MESKYTHSSAEGIEDAEDISSNPSSNSTMGDIIAERLSRRDLARGVLAVSAISAVAPSQALAGPWREYFRPNTTPSFRFPELKAGSDETHHVAEGYRAEVLIRWGDKVLGDAPAFDVQNQSAAAQAKQFGYNNDFIGYIPLARHPHGWGWGHDSNDRGLLVVNHEYTDAQLMFPVSSPRTQALVDIEMAAHGGSVLEVRKDAGKWSVVDNSSYARRITATTEMRISGPAAGNAKMKTSADPTGTKVFGMVNNCAGGVTPWGTWLTCEENFNGYFIDPSSSLTGHPNETGFKRYGVPGNTYDWGKFYDRFDIAKEPNEANRFGWVVEIDPLDPDSKPVKRTALGRFKHEGAENIVNRDGRLVIYAGDDQRFDYVYKFVTEGKVDRHNRAKNRDLLDKGILYVAKYNADGTGTWLPLVYGQGPLTAANGFANQGDVVINVRLAADLLGATKMDRPEDVEANSKTGKVYLALTNNTNRTAGQVDAANPRANNRFGHIIEMTPDYGDHAATTFTWEILVKCGNHLDPAVGASFNAATTEDGWFGMPDNVAIDVKGRLWVATDGQSPSSTGRADGLWAIETEGPARGTAKHFFHVPTDAEMCGPRFTPDLETLFLAVQHPGEESTFANPSTRWPDFKPGIPPRPSIVVITKKHGGKIAY